MAERLYFYMKKYAELALWAASIAVMAAIYSFSAQPAVKSNDLSKGITKTIVDKNPQTKDLPENEKEKVVRDYNSIIRKYAHFTLFLLLGLFVTAAMSLRFNKMAFLNIWLISLGFCLAYAVLDEVHQLFVEGRGAQITDVLIDFCGSLLGSSAVIIEKRIKKIKR